VKHPAITFFLYLIPAAAIVAAWSFLVPTGSRTAFLLGRPDEIAVAAARLVQTKVFWTDFWASASVLIQGYLLGVLVGFLTGLLAWYVGRHGRIATAYLVGLGSIPLFALAPLLIFVFGIGAGTRLIIVFLSVWIPMALATVSAAGDAERRYADLLVSLHGTRSQALRLIVAPAAFFLCLPSLKTLANAALVAVFLSEWISAENGLAKFVLASMSIYNVPEMWVGLVTFVLLGVALGYAVDLIEARLTRWRAR
jgi:NitT/TauT family transport system permease protein